MEECFIVAHTSWRWRPLPDVNTLCLTFTPAWKNFEWFFLSRKCALTQILRLYFISMLVGLYVNTCGSICLCVYICICTCIYIYRWVYMYMCAYLCMCASECTYVCIYSYVCLFIYVHLHVFIHVWAHPSAPNHVQVFSSHFRVLWRSFRPGLPFIPSLLLQWSDRTLPHGFSDIRWILVGQPLPTSHLPVSSRTLSTSFQGFRKPVDWLCLEGQGLHFHNIACYMLMATRKGRSEKGLGPGKVSLWKWARRWPPAVLLLPALQAARLASCQPCSEKPC